jgi:tRNA-2-methylthio-N6-dimethylallyladenosine synthase
MNAYDGDRLRSAMTDLGWTESSEALDSDAVIFVTCSIRDKAEQKVISELGRFRPLWEKNRRPKVALIGCMAQRTGAELARKFPWIRVVAGPRHLGAVPSLVAESMNGGVFLRLDEDRADMEDLECAPTPKDNPHKAYITIAHGCDQFCSYCIVPFVRGRFVSRSRESVLDEANRLVNRGVLEITLIGQNVNSYGNDFDGSDANYRFANLLGEVSAIKGLRRLRFTTSHPVDFSDDILEVMSSRPNICPAINLPVQSGSNKVLREMNRKYTKTEYMAAVKKIRASLPESSITTDLIVGFPGESREEFLESVSLIEETRFDLVHTAAYSPRRGTPAANRDDQIPNAERAGRLAEINEIQSRISSEINRELLGRVMEVMFDEAAPKGEGLLQGRTVTDKVVLVKAPREMTGRFRSVKITGTGPWRLDGELL